MLLSPYPTIGERIRVALLWLWGALVIAFLMVPILIPVPLIVQQRRLLRISAGRAFHPLVRGGSRHRPLADGNWQQSDHRLRYDCPRHVLGTLTAIALSSDRFPARRIIMPLVISPLIVPVVITAVGSYLFYARVGLASTYLGIILAHTALASPFVVVTVGASLTGFDRNLMRAASIAGAKPVVAFYRVMLPLILPGVLSGAAFAFVTSFDEVVVAQFLASANQRTMPLEMFIGLRERLSPAITAAATLMMLLSIILLVVANLLARRGQRRPVFRPKSAAGKPRQARAIAAERRGHHARGD